MTRSFILASILVATACDKTDNDNDKPADNTKQNERDKDGSTKTPLDQSEDKADLDITASIRRALMDDGALSTNAKNVKIVTAGGVVTLRGPVASQEKTKIAELAKGTSGVQLVDDQLEVASN